MKSNRKLDNNIEDNDLSDTNDQNDDDFDSSNNDDDCSECSAESDYDSDDSSKLDIEPVEYFTVKELCYYKMIRKFFLDCNQENILKMINIVEGKSPISLRILDWFVTKFPKKRVECDNAKGVETYDVRVHYKAQLKSYKKKYFDPFRRKKKFNFYFNDELKMKTTLGQLNFFKWAFLNGIIVYVDKNLRQIIKEMKISNKDNDKKKDTKKKGRKKKEDDKKIKSSKTGVDVGNAKISSAHFGKDDCGFTLSFD